MPNVYLGEGRIPTEKNDCTVIALAYACDISYEEAHDICKKAGRKDKKGFNLANDVLYTGKKNPVRKRLAGHRYEIKSFPRPHMTIDSLRKFRSIGNFICVVSNHAFVIKNGEVLNNRNTKQIVKYFWEIKKLS